MSTIDLIEENSLTDSSILTSGDVWWSSRRTPGTSTVSRKSRRVGIASLAATLAAVLLLMFTSLQEKIIEELPRRPLIVDLSDLLLNAPLAGIRIDREFAIS